MGIALLIALPVSTGKASTLLQSVPSSKMRPGDLRLSGISRATAAEKRCWPTEDLENMSGLSRVRGASREVVQPCRP